MNKQVLAWIVCILIMASVAYSALEKIGVGEITRAVISLAITIVACTIITIIVADDSNDAEDDENNK